MASSLQGGRVLWINNGHIMASQAVFWDRDNTLIDDSGYIDDPDLVKLLPGAADALKRLKEAGIENVVVTNQSGIARGKFDEPTLAKIHDRLGKLLDEQGAQLDAIYYCPYLDGDEAIVEEYCKDSDLRKPKPGMLIKAAMERKLDLPASWAIGDSLTDAQAGRAAGCRTILVPKDTSGIATLRKHKDVDFVALSANEAVDIVLKHTPSDKPETPGTGGQSKTSARLQEILAFLRTVDRRNRADDFSFAKLAGAVVQIVALAALLWALFAMIRNGEEAVLRMLLALVLQVMAMTFFLLSLRR